MKSKKIKFNHKGFSIELERRPFATGRNLTNALDAIVANSNTTGFCRFECEYDLLSKCNEEIIKFTKK